MNALPDLNTYQDPEVLTPPEPSPCSDDHYVTSRHYPGTRGDRPKPWQICYECACGEDLGFDEEGSGRTDPDAALETHIESLSDLPENGR